MKLQKKSNHQNYRTVFHIFPLCDFLSKYVPFRSYRVIFLNASTATSHSENCTKIPLFLLCYYQGRWHDHHLADRFVDEHNRISSLLRTIVVQITEHSGGGVFLLLLVLLWFCFGLGIFWFCWFSLVLRGGSQFLWSSLCQQQWKKGERRNIVLLP